MAESSREWVPNSDKPYRCPNPGCSKAYKQMNGAKYHALHGKCKNISENADEFPFRCYEVEACAKTYRNLNGLRYHYQHSGEHGRKGMAMLLDGSHPPFQGRPRSGSGSMRRSSTSLPYGRPSPAQLGSNGSSHHLPDIEGDDFDEADYSDDMAEPSEDDVSPSEIDSGGKDELPSASASGAATPFTRSLADSSSAVSFELLKAVDLLSKVDVPSLSRRARTQAPSLHLDLASSSGKSTESHRTSRFYPYPPIHRYAMAVPTTSRRRRASF